MVGPSVGGAGGTLPSFLQYWRCRAVGGLCKSGRLPSRSPRTHRDMKRTAHPVDAWCNPGMRRDRHPGRPAAEPCMPPKEADGEWNQLGC